MGRQHLFHTAGRQPVAGDINNVIGTRHDVHVAVLIDVTRVGGLVIAGELREIGFDEAIIGIP